MIKYTFLLLACLSFSVSAMTARDVYKEHLLGKPTGVYDQGDWVFFIVKQECLTKKKYAGTEESEAAEKIFYGQLVGEISKRDISFSNDLKGIKEPLKNVTYDKLSSIYSAQNNIRHQLLFDRDSKLEHCVNEYVQVIKKDQFGKNKVPISTVITHQIAAGIIQEAMDQEDFSLVAKYLKSINLISISQIYQMVNSDDFLPVNLRYLTSSSTTCNKAPYCHDDAQAYSEYDINRVLGNVFKFKGFAKIKNKNESKSLANKYFLMASKNYKQGLHAQKIITDLTLSLNLDPAQANAWKMLSNIYRAKGEWDFAFYSAIQYVILSPDQVEPWVYLLASQKALKSEETSILNNWLVIMNQNTPLSSWAQKQL